MTSRPRHQVAVLVRHGVLPLELGLVHQMFDAATDANGEPHYDVLTCATRPGAIRTNADFPITVTHGPPALAFADTVIVVATHEEGPPETTGELDRDLRDALELVRPDARIASICTGAFVLAAAGLLDGRRATTHWKSTTRFRSLFPSVALDPDVLYVDEGDVLTSAGEAAGFDLCLHLVRRDFGVAVANRAARATVVPPHREGGQAQYIALPVPDTGEDSTAPARSWALSNLRDPRISLEDLAHRATMSVRTFSRRFHQEVGVSPGVWLRQQRVAHALHLLERTDLPIDQVAAEAGFGSGGALRTRVFSAIGVSPRAYRATFRGVVPTSSAASVPKSSGPHRGQ
ncbi:helix-turn-helix domain-containing protein [Spiractinospora alimapuensis]|uniref:GlxA family transcriptional regulator n=1 Tax=Spiractinospora alimapuensis TaxID=2820884 RepID=UPI001F274BA3|nr:helix-turn-helix domain-containing protein [Spiractinospora alimapuensis]QVQ53046.1 helix-turn-helix domain-containing protein [Spiractinospora alimapuensis]